MLTVKSSVSLLVLCCVCLSTAQPLLLDYAEDHLLELAIEGFEPVPLLLHRVRRQEVFGGANHGPGGSTATLGVTAPLYNNNGHRVDGRGQVSKTWNPTGPTVVGGGLDYTGPRGGASLSADHNRHLGTNVGVDGRYNLYTSPNRRTTIDANGGYQRSFGGMYGTSRPNYNVGVGLNHRF